MVSGNRALGSIIAKSKTLKNIGLNKYKNIIEKGACPIISYGSLLWGYIPV